VASTFNGRQDLRMEEMLSSGMPRIGNYKEVISGKSFKEMERYSESFLEENEDVLKKYGARWMFDSLHSWSRQWEYPFVFTRIMDFVDRRTLSSLRILDCGSGLTFLPFYLANRFSNSEITCCDQDNTLEDFYRRINEGGRGKVRFAQGDLTKMPFADEEYDIAYCISVLEHTNKYLEIIPELRRVLKKGGLLVLTFDVSLDGARPLSKVEAEEILRKLCQFFYPEFDLRLEDLLGMLGAKEDTLTTKFIKEFDKDLIPWRRSLLADLKGLLRGKCPSPKFWLLTVYCASFYCSPELES